MLFLRGDWVEEGLPAREGGEIAKEEGVGTGRQFDLHYFACFICVIDLYFYFQSSFTHSNLNILPSPHTIITSTAVRKFKVVVVVVLVAAAVAVSAVVYRFTSNGERQNLQAEYNDYAAKFITNFHHLAVMRQWAAYTAAAQFTAKCIDNYGPDKRPWPNATLVDYHDQVRGLVVLAHGTTIEFSPFFPNNDTIRRGWEAYAVENEVRY